MKSKIIILIAVCAVVTLSFTFSSVNKTERDTTSQNSSHTDSGTTGGFASEDKF